MKHEQHPPLPTDADLDRLNDSELRALLSLCQAKLGTPDMSSATTEPVPSGPRQKHREQAFPGDNVDLDSFALLPSEQAQLDELVRASRDATEANRLRRIFVANLVARLALADGGA
jgi:hypothetical protein